MKPMALKAVSAIAKVSRTERSVPPRPGHPWLPHPGHRWDRLCRCYLAVPDGRGECHAGTAIPLYSRQSSLLDYFLTIWSTTTSTFSIVEHFAQFWSRLLAPELYKLYKNCTNLYNYCKCSLLEWTRFP